ncbi:MAG TPA: GMC family oxidoreductase [Candidatus Acidoferrales bacterium]|nr:GMC family oxidoreductase [Candidatus Acidoferrales bacterium]
MAGDTYDVAIVGAGVAGALIAKTLAHAGKSVVILEAGDGIPDSNADFLERFYTSSAKVPESAYTPALVDPSTGKLADPTSLNAPRPTVLTLDATTWKDPHASYFIQQGPKAFGSTYERIAGGTGPHWLGTSVRFVPNDFRMASAYGRFVDWPLSYADLDPWYAAAERELGVSVAIPPTLVDRAVSRDTAKLSVDGVALTVSPTPAARNAAAFDGRPPCVGNSSCIPICPVGAKWDPSMTLRAALATGRVTLRSKCVATQLVLGDDGRIASIDYVTYDAAGGPQTGSGSVRAKIFVVAAHGVETPKLLLMSNNGGRTPRGVANSSGQVGKNLMDHPLYLAWAATPEPVYGYRGPLSTSGIETVRDGAFRKDRAAFRIEIGNEGWNFPIGDPEVTTLDFVLGSNRSALNERKNALSGSALTAALNHALTRQFRLAFLVEQSPEASNDVTLSAQRDHLGLPRPQIRYDLSEYTKAGFAAAKATADAMFAAMGARQYTTEAEAGDPSSFEIGAGEKAARLKYFGAGHIAGTYRMGSDRAASVVNADLRSWDHRNLFLAGSGTFPTIATGNPTLTLAALALRTAKRLLSDLA